MGNGVEKSVEDFIPRLEQFHYQPRGNQPRGKRDRQEE